MKTSDKTKCDVVKTIHEMTVEELRQVPYRGSYDNEVQGVCSIVILPSNELHDSGYRFIDFVAVDNHDYPICRLDDCSDVLFIEQTSECIGRYTIDCLPISGCLRIFKGAGCFKIGAALSVFVVK